MPKEHHPTPEKETITGPDYDGDPQWRQKPLTPAQVLAYDVRIETLRQDRGPMLEINERTVSSVVPDSAAFVPSTSFARISDATNNPIEKQNFIRLEQDYGWIRHLRSHKYQKDAHDAEDSAKCRWIHVSSKFPEYLRGFLWALSNDTETIADSMRMLDSTMRRQTRFSKHGKYFAPFSQVLSSNGNSKESQYPMLISVPFLDWTVQGPTPPLRFQIDRREGFLSSRSSAHILRSILQYYYRLEDTADRERQQVFSRHKPWITNRELDLKIRGWYGHYPTGLNVDELWILVVDAEHIVTFSSNQTWKARWPPLQLSSRISDVAFRGIRNNYFRSREAREYTAMTHAIASLSGAVGMIQRSFWNDIPLCLTDRYGGHLSRLQYRLHRAPSTKLVMDLIALQEEINIAIQIAEQQSGAMRGLEGVIDTDGSKDDEHIPSPVSQRRHSDMYGDPENDDIPRRRLVPRHSTYRQFSSSELSDPLAQLVDNLQRELADLRDLRDNTDRLVTRTIQLVNIRLEDHGKAILVFTVVTIIFLPLNFVSSFFGMNVSDIRNLDQSQWLFWAVAVCVTVGVVGASLVLAFSGGAMMERLHMWRDARRERNLSSKTMFRQERNDGRVGFMVHGTDIDQVRNTHIPTNYG